MAHYMNALILKYYFLEDSDHYVYIILTPDYGSLESLKYSAVAWEDPNILFVRMCFIKST